MTHAKQRGTRAIADTHPRASWRAAPAGRARARPRPPAPPAPRRRTSTLEQRAPAARDHRTTRNMKGRRTCISQTRTCGPLSHVSFMKPLPLALLAGRGPGPVVRNDWCGTTHNLCAHVSCGQSRRTVCARPACGTSRLCALALALELGQLAPQLVDRLVDFLHQRGEFAAQLDSLLQRGPPTPGTCQGRARPLARPGGGVRASRRSAATRLAAAAAPQSPNGSPPSSKIASASASASMAASLARKRST